MVIDSRALEMRRAENGTVKETLQKRYLLERYCFSIQCTDSPDIARVCVSAFLCTGSVARKVPWLLKS